MPLEITFGQWLKERRQELDLTQVELADKVGCAAITIQKLEAGERRPSKQMAGLLAGQLGIGAEERPEFVVFARKGGGVPGWSAYTPVRSLLRARLTNLFAPPGELIGRDRAVITIQESLLKDDVRLLTLVGPPGVGKTRLAIEVATRLLGDFDDGIYFIALAHVNDPPLVPAAIAQTLGVGRSAQSSFINRLKDYLGRKNMLLILDNFEQVVTAAPAVSELLAHCPGLNILATSREPLSVRPERRYPVSPLALPDAAGEDSDLSELMGYSAIALFVERAQAVTPAFNLTADNAAAVLAICTRLDGLPLAIELLAAQTNGLPPPMLLDQLNGKQLLLADGLRDLSFRHRTLHNAIDWSYALIKGEEQQLLARSSVFVGGWTLAAAESVTGQPGKNHSATVLAGLTTLVKANLVLSLKDSGGPRFMLLETIRAYSKERLAERNEEAITRGRHAEYYLALAEEAVPYLRTADQKAWLDKLEIERGNMRKALTWFIDQATDAEKGLRLAGALGWFWNIRSHVSEGRGWLAKALQASAGAPAILRVKALPWAASLAWQQGALSEARAMVEENIALCRGLGPSHTWDLAMALSAFANVVTYQADGDAVQLAAEESKLLFQQLEDKWGEALAMTLVGEAQLLRHDYVSACQQFEKSLTLFREIGDKWAIGIPLLNWGYTDSLQGNLRAARGRLEESIAVHRDVGERFMRATTLNILAQVVQQQGQYHEAAAIYDESLDLLRQMGIETTIADVLHNLAHLAQAQGHAPLAEKLYLESLELFSSQEDKQGVAKCDAGLAAVIVMRE